MNIIDIEPGTPEWLEWRKGVCSASDAAIIMGCPPAYWSAQTWDDLRRVKAGLGDEPDEHAKKAFKHGHQKEIECRDHLAPLAAPICAQDDTGTFAASLDGYGRSGYDPAAGTHGWIEIKSPISGLKSKLLQQIRDDECAPANERVPDYVWWQIVHQAAVINDPSKICQLIIWLDKEDFTIVDIPAYELLRDWPILESEWQRFILGDEQGRSDQEWRDCANTWRQAKEDVLHAETNLGKAKNALIDLGIDQGCGVKVDEIVRQGSVDWKQVAMDLFMRQSDESMKETSDLTSWANGFRKSESKFIQVSASKI